MVRTAKFTRQPVFVRSVSPTLHHVINSALQRFVLSIDSLGAEVEIDAVVVSTDHGADPETGQVAGSDDFEVEGESCEEDGILFRVRRMVDRRIEEVEMVLASRGE